MNRETSVRGLKALLLAVFFLSGCAALIYQVAWQRLLTVHYGVGSVSVALIVSVYMGGLGLGALAGGIAAERSRNTVVLYWAVEWLTAAFGVLSPWLLSAIGSRTAGSGYTATCVYLFAFLCVPTFLMGMTLPVVTKIFGRAESRYVETVGSLYAINTLGAAVGSLLASYVIVSLWGLDVAVYTAAGINAALGAVILAVPRFRHARIEASAAASSERSAGVPVSLLVFVTGFLAIGYEVVWFRIVGVLVKDSPYAFASGLAVYLTGIATGSLLLIWVTRRWTALASAGTFFAMQWLIGLYMVVSITVFYRFILHTSLRAFPLLSFVTLLHPSLNRPSSLSALFTMFDIILWPAAFFFVPTVLMGASFPLAAAVGLAKPSEEARSLGRIYLVNIAGNVAGGLVTGFVLLPWMKTEPTLLAFAAVGMSMALLASTVGNTPVSWTWRSLAVLVPIVAGYVLFPGPGRLYAAMHVGPAGYDTLIEEGREGIVVTYFKGDRVINFINGSSHGSRPGYGFYYETIETLSYVPHAHRVLIIGFGTGSILEQVLAQPEITAVTVVEINGTSITNLRKLPLFDRLLSDSKVDLVIDDGRRYLLRTSEQFDLVLMDPLRTRTSYSNNVYSAEIAALIRQRLAPGGAVMVWTDEFKVLPRTWAMAFPYVRMHTYFLICSVVPLVRDSPTANRLIANYSDDGRRQLSAYDRSYLGDRQFVLGATAGYPINQDWRPVTEYFLGLVARYGT